MTFPLSPENTAYLAFAIGALIEFYFFLMQRCALEISRARGITPAEGRLMLPLWYLIHWPFRIMKWAAVFYVATQQSWIVGIAMLGVTFLCQVFVPIPHQQFIPIFRNKIAKEIATGENSGLYSNLYAELFEANKDPRFVR